MDCMKIRERLSALIDNEVSEREKHALEAHLAWCAECRAELAALRVKENILKALPEVTPSAGFRSRFWQKARESARVPVQTLWERVALRWIPVPVALAVLVVLFTGFSAFSPLVYGTSEQATRSESVRLAGQAFSGSANGNVFAPLNFVEYCDRCERMLCSACRGGSCTNHGCACGGMNK